MDYSKTIVLDRDGVINQDSDQYIKSHDEWSPLPGSLDAIAALHSSGYRILIATNQSGLARELFDEIALANIHHKLCSMVEEAGGFVTGIFYCPHLPDAECDCRKPKTGLLEQAESELDISLKGCPFVGDSLKDLEAARAYGMEPILVRTGKGEVTEKSLSDNEFTEVSVFNDLQSFARDLLKRSELI